MLIPKGLPSEDFNVDSTFKAGELFTMNSCLQNDKVVLVIGLLHFQIELS